MVEQTIEDRGGQHLVPEDLALVDETLVGSDDEAGALVTACHLAEEQVGFLAAHRQVAELVDDQQLGRDPWKFTVRERLIYLSLIRGRAQARAGRERRVRERRKGSAAAN